MSKTVFILGAGASLHAGAPLMDNFIQAAQALERSTDKYLSSEDKADFKLVSTAREQLQVTNAKANINLHNIESLFGAFEMARLLGKLGSLSPEQVERLPDAMVKVIARTIEYRIEYRVENSARRFPTEAYRFLAGQIDKLLAKDYGSVSVITFNYDVALDYALFFQKVSYSYGLDERFSGGMDLLKLHGSLNWAACSKCPVVIPWELRDYNMKYSLDQYAGIKTCRIEMSQGICDENHCGFPVKPLPLLVPPTWNKGRYHSLLQNVWRKAASHLSQAENIVIIGYSRPETDEFFKYFYALGSVGPSVLNNVWIIDPDDKVKQRFEEIMGVGGRNRLRKLGDGHFDSVLTQQALDGALKNII